jgi:hypothetical protein
MVARTALRLRACGKVWVGCASAGLSSVAVCVRVCVGRNVALAVAADGCLGAASFAAALR